MTSWQFRGARHYRRGELRSLSQNVTVLARCAIIFAFSLLGGLVELTNARESYPSRPVTIIVPFSAGAVGRTIASRCGTAIQPFRGSS